MKYLEQLFGQEEFVRISATLLLPYRYIHSFNGNEVVMKRMPWEKEPLSFTIDPKYSDRISDRISLRILTNKVQQTEKKSEQSRKRRKPAKPAKEKTDTVLKYIKEHAGSQTKEIADNTQYSASTVERCLAELRKQGLGKYKGSKKTGGYHATVTAPSPPVRTATTVPTAP